MHVVQTYKNSGIHNIKMQCYWKMLPVNCGGDTWKTPVWVDAILHYFTGGNGLQHSQQYIPPVLGCGGSVQKYTGTWEYVAIASSSMWVAHDIIFRCVQQMWLHWYLSFSSQRYWNSDSQTKWQDLKVASVKQEVRNNSKSVVVIGSYWHYLPIPLRQEGV